LGLTASSLLTVCPDSLNVNKFYPPQPWNRINLQRWYEV
jgi:hypothetical protein